MGSTTKAAIILENRNSFTPHLNNQNNQQLKIMSNNQLKDLYLPIDCGLHSEYELAIMHCQLCRVSWLSTENTKQTEILLPQDIVTRDKQEFLIVKKNKGPEFEIRLDKIISFETL